MNEEIFEVDHKSLFKKLRLFISVGILIPVAFAVGSRLLQGGYDYAFEHISPFQFLLIAVAIVLFSILFSYLISLYMKRARIRIENNVIHGLNYWGMKNTIPLHEITETSDFYSNGIEAVVVHSKKSGKVYISKKTNNLQRLLDIVNSQVEKNA